MEYFSEITLSDGTEAKIIEGSGINFFNAMSASKGDSGLFIKHLVSELVLVKEKKIKISEIDELPIKDASYLCEVVSLVLSDKYRNGI